MSNILSHDDTKNDLTRYLSQETFKMNKTTTKNFLIPFSSGATISNNKDIKYTINTHEEADTLMLFHGMEIKKRYKKGVGGLVYTI